MLPDSLASSKLSTNMASKPWPSAPQPRFTVLSIKETAATSPKNCAYMQRRSRTKILNSCSCDRAAGASQIPMDEPNGCAKQFYGISVSVILSGESLLSATSTRSAAIPRDFSAKTLLESRTILCQSSVKSCAAKYQP